MLGVDVRWESVFAFRWSRVRCFGVAFVIIFRWVHIRCSAVCVGQGIEFREGHAVVCMQRLLLSAFGIFKRLVVDVVRPIDVRNRCHRGTKHCLPVDSSPGMLPTGFQALATALAMPGHSDCLPTGFLPLLLCLAGRCKGFATYDASAIIARKRNLSISRNLPKIYVQTSTGSSCRQAHPATRAQQKCISISKRCVRSHIHDKRKIPHPTDSQRLLAGVLREGAVRVK